MKKLFKMNMQKSYLFLVGILSIAIVGFCYSYAMFTVQKEQKEVIQIVAGTLYSKLSDDETHQVQLFRKAATVLSQTSKTVIVIAPHEEKTVTLKIENVNNRDAKFNLYYTAPSQEGLKIGYLQTGSAAPTTEGVVIPQNASQEYTVRIYNKSDQEVSVSFGSNVGLADKPLAFPVGASVLPVYQAEIGEAIQNLLAKANKDAVYNETTEKEMYPITVNSNKQTDWLDSQRIDYRYVGSNPNNYVLLQNELYRIIGIFGTKDSYGIVEKRIKLIKASFIGSQVYNKEENNAYQSSSVKKTLEETYFANLEEETQQLIAPVEWYLGDLNGANFQDLYRNERAGSKDTIENIYQVALPYPSDYQYSYSLGYNQSCFASNQNCQGSWMHQIMSATSGWLLSYNSSSQFANSTTSVLNTGVLTFDTSLQETMGIYPTFYLNTNVKIANGDGTLSSPYQFAL